jgi:hypothetical protein
VKIDVPDEDHAWRFAEIADGVTANLKVGMQGSAGILWRAGGSAHNDLRCAASALSGGLLSTGYIPGGGSR